MLRPLATVLVLGLVAPATGCGDDPLEIVCEGKLVTGEDGRQRCVFDGPAPTPDVTEPEEDTAPSVPDVEPDPGAPPEDTATEEDTGPDPEWQCSVNLAGQKTMGEWCTKHCECESGLCYDGPYLGDFRFCTRECGGLGTSCDSYSTGDARYVCLFPLDGTDGSGSGPHAVCQVVCDDLDDCKRYGSAYDACGTLTCTDSSQARSCWGENTLHTARTCQIASEVQ
ncbi:MAG: hypothetical protein ACQEXJ_00965 [Myxococcota bacterium]